MTYKFSNTDKQVTITTEYNTRHIYLDENCQYNNARSVLALLKYDMYQKTGNLREARDTARYGLQAAVYVLHPRNVWHNVKLRTWYAWYRATALPRHYIGIARLSRRYGL
jgi:hypothetical protein